MRLSKHKKFPPCSAEAGDELFANGIFEFNISRLLSFIQADANGFRVAPVELTDIPDYGDAGLDEEAICTADLSRPILLAEIAPGRYNVIDGQHRITKARREGARSVAGHRLRCPEHVPFLTSTRAYRKYVEYWNSKVEEATRGIRCV